MRYEHIEIYCLTDTGPCLNPLKCWPARFTGPGGRLALLLSNCIESSLESLEQPAKYIIQTVHFRYFTKTGQYNRKYIPSKFLNYRHGFGNMQPFKSLGLFLPSPKRLGEASYLYSSPLAVQASLTKQKLCRTPQNSPDLSIK